MFKFPKEYVFALVSYQTHHSALITNTSYIFSRQLLDFLEYKHLKVCLCQLKKTYPIKRYLSTVLYKMF